MAKSYYAILGISSMATTDEVRAAYRRLAKAYHPDHYHGGSENFRQVQEAYSVLGNAERRRQYERQIHEFPMVMPYKPQRFPEAEPLIPESNSVQLEDVHPMHSFQSFSPSTDSLFDIMWRNFSSLLSSQFGRVRRLAMEAPITAAQARRGGTVNISVPAEARCYSCQGYGSVGIYACRRCAGEGSIAGEMPVAIAFAPNIPDNYEVIIPLARYGIGNQQVSVIFRLVEN